MQKFTISTFSEYSIQLSKEVKMIIVIGSDEDFHSKYVLGNLHRKNIAAKYLDSRIYPEISWSPDGNNDYIVLDGEKIYLKDVTGIYWRWYYGVMYCEPEIVYREKTSALESFLCSLENISYNSLQAVELHRKKGLQSKIMHQNGIRIPRTIVTNDKLALEDFYFANDKSIIYKPVRGGAFTQKFKEKDLLRTDSLVNCPAQFQEFVDGVDIRVYAFDTGEIFAGEIIANNIDFREDQNAIIHKVELPKKVQKDCLKVLKLLGLKYSGIDIRLSKQGEYVFIEANPAPMFTHFEKMSGYEITNTLIRNLTGTK